MATRVKICGLTRLDDALAATQLGADAVGFNFWPGSKRFCEPADAAEMIAKLPPFLTKVGVFVNASRDEIDRTVAMTGITVVQLHGDEPPGFCRGFEVPLVKAMRVDAS